MTSLEVTAPVADSVNDSTRRTEQTQTDSVAATSCCATSCCGGTSDAAAADRPTATLTISSKTEAL